MSRASSQPPNERTLLKSASLALALLLFCSCGPPAPSDGAPDAGGGSPDSGVAECRRYQARVAGSCVAVVVSGVDERPFEFERAGYTMHGTLSAPLAQGE